eukprot:2605081-Prymnesium_polylepis.2
MRSLSQAFATISRYFAGALSRAFRVSLSAINRRTCNVDGATGRVSPVFGSLDLLLHGADSLQQ